ncbi:MAG TPA: hypothetical protein VHK90_15970 [Thermoanaerobaculia bacterium]|nr:hypothetical protein [Thermoanaerobaculia bacterium]
MRKLLAVSLLFLAAACGSQRTNATRHIAKPGIQILQMNGVPPAARHVQGGLNIQYGVRVTNHSDETIKLRRVTVQSMSEGAYHVGPHSVAYDLTVPPHQAQDVQFWAPAQTGRSLVGANGPVTLRVTCEFDSQYGRFQEIVTRVVNDRTSITGEQ